MCHRIKTIHFRNGSPRVLFNIQNGHTGADWCTWVNISIYGRSPLTVFKREGVSLVEFRYLVFTRMPGESYRRRLRSLLLCLCDVFRALINLTVC